MRRVRSDDEWIMGPTFFGIGQVHGVMPPDEDKPDMAGKLYVPDPEQRNGWREFYIPKPVTEKPGARPLGFGKPR